MNKPTLHIFVKKVCLVKQVRYNGYEAAGELNKMNNLKNYQVVDPYI